MPPLTLVNEMTNGLLRAIPLEGSDAKSATIDVVTSRSAELSAAAQSFLQLLLTRLRMQSR